VRLTQEPGGVLVFLPGQDDIEALQSLLEENLPNIVGQQYEETLEKGSSAGGSVIVNSNKGLVGGVTVKKGILKDFEIWPLYAAMPPEEQVSGERFKVHGFDRLLTHSAVFIYNIVCDPDSRYQSRVHCVVTSHIRRTIERTYSILENSFSNILPCLYPEKLSLVILQHTNLPFVLSLLRLDTCFRPRRPWG
jgi:hypothetical protein